MVDAVVSIAVTTLSNLLTERANFLRGVRPQVEQLRNELNRMRAFLKDADAKQEGDERIHNWVSEIRDVAYDVEDVIETFILQIEEKEKEKEKASHHWHGFGAALKSYSFIFNKGMKFNKIGEDIKVIQDRLRDISEKQTLYGLKDLGGTMSSSTTTTTTASKKPNQLNRRTSPIADGEDFIGLEDAVKALLMQLTGDEVSPRRVVSIFGMGGLGKTSLARKLYNHNKVQSQFPNYRAWVYVSQEYKTKDLLQRIIKSFKTPSLEEMKIIEMSTVEDLEKRLYNLLEHHRYLVVIDDVWDFEAWESLKNAFPDKNNGSRVLLTTRKKDIAQTADRRSLPYELRFLEEKESWELFCKIAFPSNNDHGGKSSCPSHLENLGKEMVGKCGGLPLGIIVLGGLLFNKSFAHEWQKVLDEIRRMLMQDKNQMITQILALSYNDLPYELKPCFLHLSLFPEDFVIDAEKLIQLWVAEGFIPQGKKHMEDVARDYLNDLISRSMIQVAQKSWRGVEDCSIHDLIRDLAISRAEEVSILQMHGREECLPSSSTRSSRVRRLAIHSEIQSCDVKSNPHWHIRSLMVFNSEKNDEIRRPQKELRSFDKGFNLLRVLDLGGVNFNGNLLPGVIGEMIHLRYLGLKRTGLEELPASIGKLQRLQTLDLSGNFNFKLSEAVGKLGQLRNFYGRWTEMVKFDNLKNLRTLNSIHFHVWRQCDQTKLTNLRELCLSGVEESMNEIELLSLPLDGVGSNCLQSLTVSRGKYNYNPIAVGLHHCNHLRHLSLNCRLRELPNLLEYTPNLTHLELHHPELKEDPMPTLERLQNLSYLNLGGTSGRQMICSANGFPQLVTLHMYFLHELKEWTIEEGAMPRLRVLTMNHINNLMVIPEGFKFLTTLRFLNVRGMSKDLEDKWLGGEESYKIQHIPTVTISQNW